MSDAEKKPEATEEEEVVGGELLQCGATDWYSIGRTKEVRPEYPNLSVPHRLKALEVREFGRCGGRCRRCRPPRRCRRKYRCRETSPTALLSSSPSNLFAGHQGSVRGRGPLCLPHDHRRRERRVLHLGAQ